MSSVPPVPDKSDLNEIIQFKFDSKLICSLEN